MKYFLAFFWPLSSLLGLEVKFSPCPVVTEGDRVTLTCSTSCPLTDNTNYIWYMNTNSLTLPENQNKHLVLDLVSTQHAGNYSCGVKTNKKKNSTEKTLTVQSNSRYSAAVAAGVTAILLVKIALTLFCCVRWATLSFVSKSNQSNHLLLSFLTTRIKRTYSLSSRAETSDKTNEVKTERGQHNISNFSSPAMNFYYPQSSYTGVQVNVLLHYSHLSCFLAKNWTRQWHCLISPNWTRWSALQPSALLQEQHRSYLFHHSATSVQRPGASPLCCCQLQKRSEFGVRRSRSTLQHNHLFHTHKMQV